MLRVLYFVLINLWKHDNTLLVTILILDQKCFPVVVLLTLLFLQKQRLQHGYR